MKKRLVVGATFLCLAGFAVTPAIAEHDHGSSPQPMAQPAHGGGEQRNSEGDEIAARCARQVSNLDRRVNVLQMQMAGKRVPPAMVEELKKLEEKLNEAYSIARPLQIM